LFPSVAFTTKSILRNEVSLCNRLFINRKIWILTNIGLVAQKI
jgi:hypothetical protein